MDRNNLLATAQQLKQVNEKAANEYIQKTDKLVNSMNIKMQGRDDIEDLVGKKNLTMMQDNHSNHARFIGSLLKNYNAEVFVDTVLWVFRAYRSRGFHSNYWAAQLNTWIEIIKAELSPESYTEIYPYYEWMQISIPIFVKLSDEKLEAPNSMH